MKKPKNDSAGQGGYGTEDARWNAVVLRDPGAVGCFYYSVATTGVFCHPTCPSRRPRRENIRFHNSIRDAERAGFRACKRCRPGGLTIERHNAAVIADACRTIESAEELPSLDSLAKAARMSRFHFHRLFKKITGLTPKAFATAHRAERVRKGFPKRRKVTETFYEVDSIPAADFIRRPQKCWEWPKKISHRRHG